MVIMSDKEVKAEISLIMIPIRIVGGTLKFGHTDYNLQDDKYKKI